VIVYTAGPYSHTSGVGSVNANIFRAREVAIQLWNAGYTVICPHMNTDHLELYTTLKNKDFVDRDLEIVERCDAIVMLPYWESSKGAVRELEHARSKGLKVWFWPEVPGVQKSSKAWDEGRTVEQGWTEAAVNSSDNSL
jgi:hypothetical protein